MRKRIFKNNEGISPVLGFILILAIGVSLLSTVQLSFVPVWNTQEELDHIKLMQDDFKVLKSGIETSVQSGTSLSVPLTMGFKYSPKMFVYNPKESAYASLDIRDDTWVEVRYNELFQDGMTDETSIKNLSTSRITYSLKGAQNYDSFIYEHGIIRRSSSSYTTGSQTLLANNTLYTISVKPLGSETASAVEKRTVNIYPTSQQKNSIIGKKAYLILHTKPEYVNWWNATLANQGGELVKIDQKNGNIMLYFDSIVIKMGETYISTTAATAPAHASPFRLVKITPENTILPVDGVNNIEVEVQDSYNNPVPNVQVNFSINESRKPANANATASLLQNSALSGTDGRANVKLKTAGAGFYYIDASLSSPAYKTTFAYPASSQGYVLSLSKNGSGSLYGITARLTDSFGIAPASQIVNFETGDGNVTPSSPSTNTTGYTSTTLNTITATGFTLTNIRGIAYNRTAARIYWDTNNNITVSAKSGYIFNYIDVPTSVTTTGCVRYGTSSRNYSNIQCDVTGSSHFINLTGLRINTPYYYIVNSSYSGVNKNSSEYMFVTLLPDFHPPTSLNDIINSTYESIFINWAWTNPSEEDFDNVEVYIDNIYITDVHQPLNFYNATYFKPNSMHTISTHTNDIFNDKNETWSNHTAYTSPAYTYVTAIQNTTGTVIDFNNSKSASDNKASAQFIELYVLATGESNYYSNVSGYTNGTGTLANFTNMINGSDGGAFATMTEGQNIGSVKYGWPFAGDNESWTSSYSWISQAPGAGYVYMGFNATVGNPSGCLYSGLMGDNAKARAASTIWSSPNFTWTNGIPISASLDFNWKVETYYMGDTGNRFYVDLVKPNGTTSRIYQPETFITTTGWVNRSNNTVSTNDFSQSGNYSIRFTSELYVQKGNGYTVEVKWDNPTINLNYSNNTYSLNMTTNFSSVPEANNYYLEINYSVSNDDNYSVQILNKFGTGWNDLDTLNSRNWTIFNNTLSGSEFNKENPSVRFVDKNQSGITQGKLLIDYIRIHSFSPGTVDRYALDVETNITAIPDKSNQQMLQIQYNVTNHSFDLQVWNYSTSTWNTRTTLNESGSSMFTREIPLSSSELLLYDTLDGMTPSFNLNRYYTRVRYIGENVTYPGKLNLDYQRVYTS